MRSCKRALNAIFGTRKLTDEVLSTTFCLVKQPLNACPITPTGPDSTEWEVLTPNLFILGENSVSFPSLTLDESFGHRKRYVRTQAYAYDIWQRWLKEYVSSLNKWHADSNIDFQTVDFVGIVDPSSLHGHYPLG